MRTSFLLARTVGAGLVLALAVCYGCVAPGAVTIPTRAEIRADLRAELRTELRAELRAELKAQLSAEFSAFKTEVGAKIGEINAQRDVNASTNNFDPIALYLLIAVPAVIALVAILIFGYPIGKALSVKFGVDAWIQRMRENKGGGVT